MGMLLDAMLPIRPAPMQEARRLANPAQPLVSCMQRGGGPPSHLAIIGSRGADTSDAAHRELNSLHP